MDAYTEEAAVYNITLMEILDDFKERIKQGYLKDVHQERLLDMLKKPSAKELRKPIASTSTKEVDSNQLNFPTKEEASGEKPSIEEGSSNREGDSVLGILFMLRDNLIYYINGE